jgi:hypothetical protein
MHVTRVEMPGHGEELGDAAILHTEAAAVCSELCLTLSGRSETLAWTTFRC